MENIVAQTGKNDILNKPGAVLHEGQMLRRDLVHPFRIERATANDLVLEIRVVVVDDLERVDQIEGGFLLLLLRQFKFYGLDELIQLSVEENQT